MTTHSDSISWTDLDWQRWVFAVLIVVALQVPGWFVIGYIHDARIAPYEIQRAQGQEVVDDRVESIDPRGWQAHRFDSKLCVWECSERYKAYRFEFGADTNNNVLHPSLFQPGGTESQTIGLYVSRYDAAIRVYLNAHMLVETGRLRPPVTDGSYHPLYINLPTHLLKSDANEVLIINAGWSVPGHMVGRIYVGPDDVVGEIAGFARLMTVDVLTI